MSSEPTFPGLITRAQSGFFTVETERGPVVCQLRGRLKRRRRSTDLAAAGDRVQVRILEDGSGLIEMVEPRERSLSRRAPSARGPVEQVIVANPDQAVFVFSCADPPPNFRVLDRFLVVAERAGIPPIICANKLDLVEAKSAREAFAVYQQIGYPVFFTSAKSGKGVAEIRKSLRGKISVLSGPSGAGKTSLLNAVQPGLGLRTREVREKTRKGHHTTVVPELLPLEGGGYVADTPGLRSVGLWDIEPEELDGYFPEIRPLVQECAFNDCTHLHEPGCAVIAAVEAGSIDPERYDSYCRMRLTPGDEAAR
ncbi:MAG: ribosome small subunit-dependent GTPase A [Chloroflexi bacterium RBG_13_66_10]|nr:MAG: ribosome small subunit-dependent GTPase A [Chloroflexi bacterium RBG_13_66_10]